MASTEPIRAETPEQVGVLQKRLRLAHQARRAKEHQLDDIRRALCDIGFMDDDDPYSHADLADVIRQNGHALTDQPAAQASYPLTSPEWRPEEGHERCPFRMNTGDGRLQCTFRAGHPPHGHALNATNPGEPYCTEQPYRKPTRDQLLEAVDRVRALHHDWEADPGRCAHCQDGTGTPLPWPCPTIRALEG